MTYYVNRIILGALFGGVSLQMVFKSKEVL